MRSGGSEDIVGEVVDAVAVRKWGQGQQAVHTLVSGVAGNPRWKQQLGFGPIMMIGANGGAKAHMT